MVVTLAAWDANWAGPWAAQRAAKTVDHWVERMADLKVVEWVVWMVA
jgi:hypothetical protein